MKQEYRWITFTALASLMLIPFYKMGAYNDFAMRVSIPSLFILAVVLAQYMMETKKQLFRYILITLFVIGSYSTASEIGRSFSNFGAKADSMTTLEQSGGFISQYIGSGNNFFFKVLCRNTTIEQPANNQNIQ